MRKKVNLRSVAQKQVIINRLGRGFGSTREEGSSGPFDEDHEAAAVDAAILGDAAIASGILTASPLSKAKSPQKDGLQNRGSVPSYNPNFHELLHQLGDEHERLIKEFEVAVKEEKSQCANLRFRLAHSRNSSPTASPAKFKPRAPDSSPAVLVPPSVEVGTSPGVQFAVASTSPSLPFAVPIGLPNVVPSGQIKAGLRSAATSDVEEGGKDLESASPRTPRTPPFSSRDGNGNYDSQRTADSQRTGGSMDWASENDLVDQDRPTFSVRRSKSRSFTVEDDEYQVHDRWIRSKPGARNSAWIRGSVSAKAGAFTENLDAETTVSALELPRREDHSLTFRSKCKLFPVPKHLVNGKRPRMAQFIGPPNTRRRVVWDLIGLALILYDLIVIPLRVFDPPENSLTNTMEWLALVFWTLNMFASVTVGYYEDGRLEMRPVKIFKHYFRFWFWLDTIVVVPDWCFTLIKVSVGSEPSGGQSVKLLRGLRLVRCMRLLRLAKLKWIIASIKDLINSESMDISFNIVKMILCLIAINHFVACAWFATTVVFDAGPKWVDVHKIDGENWEYKYATSFHWAITQFTPASMHVQPQNMLERVFAITVVIFGLVGFSYLVGSITGSLSELRRLKEESAKQFWSLRRFLKKSQVPLGLRIRIEKYLEHAWTVQTSSATSGNLPILKLLTEQLRNELNCGMSMPHLEVHPLFNFLRADSDIALQRVATKALTRRLFARNEMYFQPGEIAESMSFVVAGRLQYTRTFGGGQEDKTEWVDKGEDWITEPALWIPEWVALGEVVAFTVCELLEVSSEGFAEAIKKTPQVYDNVCTYAANFVAWINKKQQADLSDICQGDQITSEISAMLFGHDSTDEDPDEEISRSPSVALTWMAGWRPQFP